MTKIKKIALIAGGVVAGLLVILAIGLFSLGKLLCDSDNLHEYKSPSGTYTIHQTVMDCGATTDFVTSLNVGLLKTQIISIKGEHENDLSVKWIDDKNIIVNYTGDPELIYNYKTEVSGIKIHYKSGEQDLKISCLYNQCEQISRTKEIERRKEWCNYSLENKKTCNETPGYETCNDLSWCHYLGPNQ